MNFFSDFENSGKLNLIKNEQIQNKKKTENRLPSDSFGSFCNDIDVHCSIDNEPVLITLIIYTELQKIGLPISAIGKLMSSGLF